MEKRGGSRIGAGRKKGSGLSSAIKKCVDNLMAEMLTDDLIKENINQDLIKLNNQAGWIYVIEDTQTGFVKIGVTQNNNPKTRLSHYLSHNMSIKLLYLDKIDYCFELEKNIHNFFSKKRVKGDWFELSKDNVLNIFRIVSEFKYKNNFNGRW